MITKGWNESLQFLKSIDIRFTQSKEKIKEKEPTHILCIIGEYFDIKYDPLGLLERERLYMKDYSRRD